MNKTIITIILMLSLIIFTSCSQSIEKESTEVIEVEEAPTHVDCPRGRVNENYAGCYLFVDENNDGNCDLSEPY